MTAEGPADSVRSMGRSQAARTADAVVVVLLALSAQVQIWSQDASSWQSGPAANAALAAIGTLPLLVRRRHPLLALSVIVVAGWLQYELDAGLGQTFFAMVIALYSLDAHGSRRDALLGLGVVAAAILATDVPRLANGEPWDEVVPAWFVLAGIWGFGRWMRWRRKEMRQLHEHATVLERTRDEDARTAVAAERARIARELHDLVAHSMVVIVIQSQAAQRVLRDDPAAADRALRSIESTGRQGMAEMRRLLDVLVGSDDDVPHAPQPSLRHVDALVDQVRAAGLPVDLRVEGTPRELPPGVDLSAYRIVQEALTNTIRHAGPARATVRLRYHHGGVEVEVTDDGARVGDGSPPGRGLIGMRERVALYGVTLDAGPAEGGGYRVRADLPVDTVESARA